MIAQRLRPIGWVAGVAGAALCFYLVSLQVAAERAELEGVERKIVTTLRQIRQLETEFSARASLRQLEAYNDDVLALSAPKTAQYLTNEVQLASYSADGAGQPQAQMAQASAPAARPTFRPAVVTDAKTQDAPVIPAAKRAPALQTVAMFQMVEAPKAKPIAKAPVPQKIAMLDALDMGEIARKAAKEAKAKQQ